MDHLKVEASVYEADKSDRDPCCAITEGGWTWFGSILLTMTLFALFHLKYKKKVISRPQNLKKHKNEQVLKGYLLAQQKAARTEMPDGNLSIAEFEKCCDERRRYPIIFKIEYGTVSAGLDSSGASQAHGRAVGNQSKNRSADIVPNDDNRVLLKVADPCHEYINASRVHGLFTGNDYIVTQGPLDNTVGDFWRMVWQEKCGMIVMLTKTFDYIRVMCAHYWPPSLNRENMFEDIGVTLWEEAKYASFVRRRLRLVRSGEVRHVTHFQFTEWPCYSSPHTGALLHFRRMVAMEESLSALPGPTVVHCHDGGGRSGVYVMLDTNIKHILNSGQVNIFSYLRELRKQRTGLVASQDQYKLIYSLVEEYLIIGDTLQTLQQFMTRTQDDERINDEFQKLNKIRPELTQGDCAAAHRVENRSKNRSVLVLAPDKYRPYITSFQGSDCTDYINAVFVDGFSHLNEFIVTEWPLSNTIQNFWSMVYDHDAVTIVVLGMPRSSTKYPSFWPEFGKPRKYGPVFSVEQVKLEEEEADGSKDNNHSEHADLLNKSEAFVAFRVNISKKEVAPHRKSLFVDDQQGKQMSALTNLVSKVGSMVPSRKCKIFQLTSHTVSPTVKAKMMMAANSWRQSEKPESPILVVSSDGQSGAGVWCAAGHCWDQVTRDQAGVDMVNSVRCVRISRPGLVTSQQEYREIRDVVRALVNENKRS